MSGELRSRPGIDQVRAGILARQYDLILVEDSSRLYRDDVACVELVRLAVDQEIRTICINDFVDTTQPDWEERLKEAARYHAAANRYGSQRVKRSHEELWSIGAALGHLKPGYLREISSQDTETDLRKAPKFDKVDPSWARTIEETYERIAAQESPWSVACWLTRVGLPKTANSQTSAWTDRNVTDLIRWTDYRGFQTFRDHISKKEYTSGKHKSKRNLDREAILTRDMPNLRIVSDALWYSANAVIDARAPVTEPPLGRDNPQFGIARDSRGPLAGVFLCRCDNKMRPEAGTLSAYRCRLAHAGGCWNKATSPRDKTHAWIAEPALAQLQTLNGRIDKLLTDATKLLDDGGRRVARKAELGEAKARLEKIQERLGQALELAERSPKFLVSKLEKCEARLARIDAKLDRLQGCEKLSAPPTRKEADDRLNAIMEAFRKMDRTSRDEIKALVGEIRAVPYQQFDTNKVVLRARFELRLSALLPVRTRAALADLCEGPIHEQFDRIPMLIDLFEPSTGPKYGMEALRLKEEEGLGLTAIGRKLGITKRQANIATQYGEAMRAAGMTDPYVELTAPPAAASRWRKRGEGAPRKKKKE